MLLSTTSKRIIYIYSVLNWYDVSKVELPQLIVRNKVRYMDPLIIIQQKQIMERSTSIVICVLSQELMKYSHKKLKQFLP